MPTPPLSRAEPGHVPQRVPGMTASTGRLYFWQGGGLWLGEGTGRTQWHAHQAHQLAVAVEGSFRFRTEADDAWTTYEGAIVPSHCTHQFELDGATIAHLFVEPESRARGGFRRLGAPDAHAQAHVRHRADGGAADAGERARLTIEPAEVCAATRLERWRGRRVRPAPSSTPRA